MYNNYNPYNRYIGVPQPQIQQPVDFMQNRQVLNGKQVESIDVVKAMDIPLDGSISYFPLADGTAIITKQLQNDGTSKITVFKPYIEQKEENKYVTSEELKKSLEKIDLSDIDDLKEEIKELKAEIKKIKKKED